MRRNLEEIGRVVALACLTRRADSQSCQSAMRFRRLQSTPVDGHRETAQRRRLRLRRCYSVVPRRVKPDLLVPATCGPEWVPRDIFAWDADGPAGIPGWEIYIIIMEREGGRNKQG